MIQIVKGAVLDYLKAQKAFKGFSIEEFPDKFEKYQFSSAKGCLLIRDDGSNFSRPNVVNKVNQTEIVRVAVVIGLRYSYYKKTEQQDEFVKQVINELRGLKILDARLYPVTRDNIGLVQNDVWHEVVFEIQLLRSDSGVHNTLPEFEATENTLFFGDGTFMEKPSHMQILEANV